VGPADVDGQRVAWELPPWRRAWKKAGLERSLAVLEELVRMEEHTRASTGTTAQARVGAACGGCAETALSWGKRHARGGECAPSCQHVEHAREQAWEFHEPQYRQPMAALDLD
jgi:hypothetical protein